MRIHLDRPEVLHGSGGGVEQVHLAVVVGAPREDGNRAAVGALPQLDDVPAGEHVRGGDAAGAQVQQAQPGVRLLLAENDRVPHDIVPGDQGDHGGIGERQMVGDARGPAGQRDRRAVGRGEAVQLRDARTGQEEQRAGVGGPARAEARGHSARGSAEVGEPELDVGAARAGERVGEPAAVRCERGSLRDTTVDDQFGGQSGRPPTSRR